MEIIDGLVESVDKEVADIEKSRKIVRRLTKDFGGEQIYIPQERFAFREEFQEEVYADFDGVNLRELSQKYGISKNTVRKIIKDVRKRRRDADKWRQGLLF